MTLTGESFVSPLTKCMPQWFALRQKEVHALPHCFDKGYELRSAGKTHDSLECTQGCPASAPPSHARDVENALRLDLLSSRSLKLS